MALDTLGHTDIKAKLIELTAKTPIEKNSIEDKWSFRVLVDGTWFFLEYSTLVDAQTDWNSFT